MTDTPSDRARELLQGAYDTHMHISPDVVERIVDDISLARMFKELGMAGFVLKSHYGSTAERASVVRAAVPGADVLGAISLNRAVGGINPLAVEIAAREGARTVWLPTVDSVNESHEREAAAGAKVPVWVKLQLELREQGIEIPPVAVVDERGAVLPETIAVLERVAHHDLLLRVTVHHGSRLGEGLVVKTDKAPTPGNLIFSVWAERPDQRRPVAICVLLSGL